MDEEEREGDTPIVLGTSTKQPTKQEKKPTKCQQMEAAEGDLIQRAITCMDKAIGKRSTAADGYELFGRYVADELRTLPSPQTQRWAKLQIQQILYNVAEVTTQPQPVSSYLQPRMDALPPFHYSSSSHAQSDQVSSGFST